MYCMSSISILLSGYLFCVISYSFKESFFCIIFSYCWAVPRFWAFLYFNSIISVYSWVLQWGPFILSLWWAGGRMRLSIVQDAHMPKLWHHVLFHKCVYIPLYKLLNKQLVLHQIMFHFMFNALLCNNNEKWESSCCRWCIFWC